MRIRIFLRSTTVPEIPPSLRPPLTVDGLGTTRTEGLARLREAIQRRMMEGESVGQVFRPDGTDTSGWKG
jgi:hypothetical protein